MIFTEKMIKEALTAVIIFWVKPRKGYESMKRYSLDSNKNKEIGNPDPGINRLYKVYIQPELGNYRAALIVDNQNGECLRAWNHYGQEEEPSKYNKKLKNNFND